MKQNGTKPEMCDEKQDSFRFVLNTLLIIPYILHLAVTRIIWILHCCCDHNCRVDLVFDLSSCNLLKIKEKSVQLFKLIRFAFFYFKLSLLLLWLSIFYLELLLFMYTPLWCVCVWKLFNYKPVWGIGFVGSNQRNVAKIGNFTIKTRLSQF